MFILQHTSFYPGNPDFYGCIFTAENTLYKEKRRRANRGYKDRLFIRIFEKKHLKNTHEEGVAEGDRKRSIRTARNLYRKGYSPQEAADILEEDEKTVAAWYKKWSKM